MATYVSEETDKPTPIVCRYCDDYPGGEKFYDKPTKIAAVRLRGQWAGGDQDVDPQWVPVCWEHDSRWDVDDDADEVLDPKYRLPAFDLENWWVVIERSLSPETFGEDAKDMVIGPYPSLEDAKHACDESMLVQAELEDPGGTDCFVQSWKGLVNVDLFDVVLITLDDPTYTGRGE